MTSINQNTNTSSNPANRDGDQAVDRWTIKRLLDWTTNYFQEKGCQQPRLDAEILLAQAMDCQRIELYTRFAEQPANQPLAVFREWVHRHGQGEPVAYLVGHKEFFSLKFEVNSDVLIPRPETEHLVSEVLDRIKLVPKPAEQIRVIDVGTGSGNIAIAIAKHAPGVQVTAVDVSPAALDVAKRNARSLGVIDSVQFLESDLLQAVDGQAFDFVVSNPPYIGMAEQDQLDKSVVDFEPHAALFSGDSGTETISRLIEQSRELLVSGGNLLFELSPQLASECVALVERSQAFVNILIIKDLAGLKRLLIATRK